MAAAVTMTVFAVVMGQRKKASQNEESLMAGSVGRRFAFVDALASGMAPTKNNQTSVEMAGSDYRRHSDESTVSLDVDQAERGRRSYAV